MFEYDYVTLNNTQVEARRILLDQAGWHAYLAPMLLLSAVCAYRQLIPTSSHVSTRHEKPSLLAVFTRRTSWLLNTTYIPEFGPLHVQLLGLLYTAYLLFRITHQTGNDYMHVTKAFGHVAVSQLPMHYLLSIKSPSSPITKITGLTHERLNAYHRLFGRLIHALLATHAILYLRFFVKVDVLSKRIQHWDVRLGIIAFWTVNFLGILSIPPVRAKTYHKVFYRSHVVLSALLLAVLWFHVPYTRIYVGQAAIAWVLNGVLRKGATQTASVKCEMVGNDLVRVKARVGGKHLYPYVPGVHVYLNQGELGPRTPFTVVDARALEKDETEVKLVAKNSDGPMTGALAEAAKNGSELTLDLEGPYGEAQVYVPELLPRVKGKHEKFLLVAGGVGATYALPIYKALLDAGADPKDVRVIWVVSKEEDVKWAAPFMASGKESPIVIHITQPATSDTGPHQQVESRKDGRPDFDNYVADFVSERLVHSTRDPNSLERDPTKTDQKLYGTVTVMVCGPRGLSSAVRRAVGRHVWDYGRDVRWYEEQFGFGSS